jgi:hypothetical protein
MRLDDAITTFAINGILSSWDSYWWGSNNYELYHHPGDDRFVLLSDGMDWLMSERESWPAWRPDAKLDPLFPTAVSKMNDVPGRLAVRIRQIPALDQQYRAAVGRVMRRYWEPAKLLARIERVAATLHAAKLTDVAFVRDLAAFDANVKVVRDYISQRKAYVEALVP